MKDWKELSLQELRWVQPGMGREYYELRDPDNEVIATLNRVNWWRSYYEVNAPGNRWSFERKGIFRQHVVIRSIVTGDEPAHFEFRGMSGGGRLTFHDGRVFHWRQSNFLGTKWVWTDDDGTPVLGFQDSGLLRYNGEMSIAPLAEDMPSLALLVFLGWYLRSLQRQDAAAAVVVTAGG
jgi:hypothetical protein